MQRAVRSLLVRVHHLTVQEATQHAGVAKENVCLVQDGNRLPEDSTVASLTRSGSGVSVEYRSSAVPQAIPGFPPAALWERSTVRDAQDRLVCSRDHHPHPQDRHLSESH